MSWSDKEIDKLFQENSNAKSFEYKNEYWSEMEALLPSKTGKDLLWIFTSIAFVGLLLTAGVVGKNRMISMNENSGSLIAENTKSSTENRSTDSNSKLNSAESNLIIQEASELSVINDYESVVSHTTTGDLNNNNPLGFNNENSTLSSSSDTSDDKQGQEGSEIKTGLPSLTTDQVQVASSQKKVYGEVGLLSLLPIKNLNGMGVSKEIQLTGLPQLSPHKPIQTQLYIAGLGGVSQSMITPSDKVSSSFGVGVGLQVRKGAFLFNFGLNGVVGLHNDIELSRESKVYGFGSTYYSYELNYSNIYNLEGDFSIGYQFNRSIFSLGIRPSYVVGTKVSMRTQENEGDFIQENYFGYFDGINKFGVKPMIGYTYKFGSGLSLGLNVGVQLMPLIQEKYINGVSNRFPIDGQLILKKTLNFIK